MTCKVTLGLIASVAIAGITISQAAAQSKTITLNSTSGWVNIYETDANRLPHLFCLKANAATTSVPTIAIHMEWTKKETVKGTKVQETLIGKAGKTICLTMKSGFDYSISAASMNGSIALHAGSARCDFRTVTKGKPSTCVGGNKPMMSQINGQFQQN